VLGVAVVAVWLLLRRRGADPQVMRALTALGVLLAVQGAIGGIQYALELPAEIVWVHVTLAAFTWLCILWAVMAAGRLVPREAREAPRALSHQQG
jgi:cytochrome c oxidase assembly protein subunit 15